MDAQSQLEKDIDTMRDVCMSPSQTQAYNRIVSLAEDGLRYREIEAYGAFDRR